MQELANLDVFLCSNDSPDGCLMLSDLDGFLTGIACSPEMIPETEWIALALGGTLEVPEWVKQTIVALFGNILQKLLNDPPFVEPSFWLAPEGEVIAMDWCAGFIDAVSLRPRKWLRLTESGTQGHLMTPLMLHMLDDAGSSLMGIPQEDLNQALDEAAEAIPEAVVGIYRFWQEGV
ncbi:hypothetical protein DSM110093_00217 [Sulfitobacter sp. DSM 110093]|uniref:YecA/YgfB family protein n=1 Tax=Sulfitobacter sp. DSM 110093 TaxID=2883127 RepID=UPI001FABBDA8|nr:YecA family protein [Sulfitobacter sp. DSM 110093]UOA30469.1 hypothetical protein DSM110093_00217 [Sulfitobacter sp. DSM 110093]